MQLNCPNCAEAVPAEYVNIQELIAICPNCDAVFRVEAPANKVKRRKVKQPEHLTVHDTDHLHLSYKNNFGQRWHINFGASLFAALALSALTAVMFNEYRIDDVPLLIPLFFSLLTLSFLYFALVSDRNHTHVEIKDDVLRTHHEPLLQDQVREVNILGVRTVHCEETPESKASHSPLPRYNVWLETENGSRRNVVNNLPEDYAYFITQRIEAYLHLDEEAIDSSHLQDTVEDNIVLDGETKQQIASQQQ